MTNIHQHFDDKKGCSQETWDEQRFVSSLRVRISRLKIRTEKIPRKVKRFLWEKVLKNWWDICWTTFVGGAQRGKLSGFYNVWKQNFYEGGKCLFRESKLLRKTTGNYGSRAANECSMQWWRDEGKIDRQRQTMNARHCLVWAFWRKFMFQLSYTKWARRKKLRQQQNERKERSEHK